MFSFPFTTCETNTNGSVAQPFSAIANAVTCLTLLALLLLVAKTTPVRILLGSFAAFEAWLAFSHVKHIPGTLETDVVHALSYSMTLATLDAILFLSGRRLSTSTLSILCLLFCVDLYIWFYVKGLWTVVSGLTIFAVVVFGNYKKLPSFFRSRVSCLASGLLLLLLLLANETRNCESMMRFKVLPYHVLVEILGFVLFVSLSVLFLEWEKLRA
jgi:hypothetical protein